MTQADDVRECDQWRYAQEEDCDGDCRKIEHLAVNSVTGELVRVDFTPYHPMPHETFQMLALMGFPARRGQSPWRAEDVGQAFQIFRQQEVKQEAEARRHSFVEGVH